MSLVGVVVHHERAEAAQLADAVADWLRERGHGTRVAGPAVLGDGEPAQVDEAFAQGADLVLSIGGDGTMLRAVGLAACHDVPVLGVNVGHLGYLTEVEADGWAVALERFLDGRYGIDERMLLTVEVEPAGGGAPEPLGLALNEAVLEKSPDGHSVRLEVRLDGEFFTTYVADGIIVATPTGSTAYSFSARGPIVDPTHRAVLLTPVSPHMLFDRTLVLAPAARVRVAPLGRPAELSIDGRRVRRIVDGEALACRAAEHPARLVTFGGRDFHQILKAKFGLSDR